MFRYALLTVLALCLPGTVLATDKEVASMSVMGTGTVTAKPDEGYITLAIVTTAEKSSVAVRNNSLDMKVLYGLLAKNGVKTDDIQTLEFSISDNYKTVQERDLNKNIVTKQVKDGYVVNNTIRVTICDLDKFGDILDAVTSRGANSVHNIRFGSSKSAEKLKEARLLAVADALAKAKSLTDAAGVKLGRVVTIAESSGTRMPLYAQERAFAPASADSSVPVSGGSMNFSVTVAIKFDLEEKVVVSPPPKFVPRGVHPNADKPLNSDK